MQRTTSFFRAALGALICLVALTALSVAVVRQPRQNGGLRKSTDDPVVQNSAKQPPPKPAPAPKPNPQPQQQPPAPKPPPQPAPPVKPRSSDPLVRAEEDLQEAKEALNRGDALKAYRDSNAVARTIETQKYDQVGVDGQRTKADEFRHISAEALQVAKESGKRLNQKNVKPAKPLTFYF